MHIREHLQKTSIKKKSHFCATFISKLFDAKYRNTAQVRAERRVREKCERRVDCNSLICQKEWSGLLYFDVELPFYRIENGVQI